ncbi:MAG: DUF1959 domain-containing protein [Methanoregulaceae archaeon]|nr:DUF1959 domain-containing protein [Methanoregulaceae archaeon]
MNGYLYEQDLSSMKYAILASNRHDRMVREIADDLGIPQLKLRRYMMDRFDMLLMENLPARYEQGKVLTSDHPVPDRDLRTVLYSHAVPLISEEKMDWILARVKKMIGDESSEEEAVAAGKRMIREAILG